MLEIHLRLDKSVSHRETVFAKVIRWPCAIRIGEAIYYGGHAYLVDSVNHDILNNLILVSAYDNTPCQP